jgi:tetratricopeptide (TPR) repeat protein
MKRTCLLLVCLLAVGLATAQDHSMSSSAKPASLMSGLGDLHHAVNTTNPEAQQFFDQGLRLVYAFNHDEAARSFQHAAELDPNLAMAYWGVAEAVGPNYNMPVDAAREKQAYDAIQKALTLSAKGPANERAYIEALSQRFTNDASPDYNKLAQNYTNAMRGVMKKYPDDLDAATLFAEAEMNLRPWNLWNHDGTPAPGTEEIVSVLESVLRRDPNHMGAVHYYIHAVEASNSPERALAGANRLAAMAPSAGHIVHMPAHIYIRTGDYAAAVETNEKAAEADRAYIQASGAQGIYPMMYYSHNLHFIAIAGAMNGRYKEAMQSAQQLAEHIRPMVKDVPPAEPFMTIPMLVQVRFQKWDDILQVPQPDPSFPKTTAVWHFARGLAFSSTGKVQQAEAEHVALQAIIKKTPADEIYAMPIQNHTRDIYKVADNMMAANIAMAKNDNASAIRLLNEAVTLQDGLLYGEPPDWPIPSREALGNALLKTGNPQEAEKVFRADLEHNLRNPRSLLGLQKALKAQGRDYESDLVQKQFKDAWKDADPEFATMVMN